MAMQVGIVSNLTTGELTIFTLFQPYLTCDLIGGIFPFNSINFGGTVFASGRWCLSCLTEALVFIFQALNRETCRDTPEHIKNLH